MRPVLSRNTLVIHVGAIFISAALLFSIQPIVAKLVLPRLGGSPAVWTTAMLFFQAVLLAGYLYAHFLVRRLAIRGQALVHGAILIAGAVFLPIALPSGWSLDSTDPATPQVLWLFALMVGLPFFALSANAPLLQHWYTASGRADAGDPYFLYAASNVGSVVALLGYPILAEPFLGASSISWIWAGGYLVFGLCLVAAALSVAPRAIRPAEARSGRIAPRRILRWIALAALPSSMMLSTTQVIATDLGSFPLLWAIPLALYLLSFVIAFTRRKVPEQAVGLVFMVALIFTVIAISQGKFVGLHWWGFGLLITLFLATAIIFHRTLYKDRPAAGDLTVFYLSMSIGGVLGGVFNAAIAPLIFVDLIEAEIGFALAGLILVGAIRPLYDLVLAAAIVGLVVGADLAARRLGLGDSMEMIVPALVAAFAMLLVRRQPLTFSVIAAGLLTAGYISVDRDTVHRGRSFFGVYAVRDFKDQGLRELAHGTTSHGTQYIGELGRRPTPTSYYDTKGPMAEVVLRQRHDASIGVIGLGIGSLACLARAGQRMVFYEIDAEIDRIARDPKLFDFMHRCGKKIPTVLGDARVELEKAKDVRFDLLVVDAFSSDSIPLHLVTMEAVRLYRARLAKGGVLMFHISNRYFDLAPVLGRAAGRLGFVARIRRHGLDGKGPPLATGVKPSIVVAMSLGGIGVPQDPRWKALADDGRAVWTDDHASLLTALR